MKITKRIAQVVGEVASISPVTQIQLSPDGMDEYMVCIGILLYGDRDRTAASSTFDEFLPVYFRNIPVSENDWLHLGDVAVRSADGAMRIVRSSCFEGQA